MPTKAKEALQHVASHHPEVHSVVYGPDGRWLYFGDAFESPTFGDEIDIGLLEDAADSLDDLPAVFTIAFEPSADVTNFDTLHYAARQVVACWESGDLAAAVRALSQVITATQKD